MLPKIDIGSELIEIKPDSILTLKTYDNKTDALVYIRIQLSNSVLYVEYQNVERRPWRTASGHSNKHETIIASLNRYLSDKYVWIVDTDPHVNNTRRDKTNYYLDIAETVASRATCLRRKYGAIIVKDDQIIATGYNSAPRGVPNCCDLGQCAREKNNIPHGERYEQCRAIHAEMNAIISASRTDMLGQTLYLVGLENGNYVEDATPCLMCTRAIVNAGLHQVIIRKDKHEYVVLSEDDLMAMLNS